MDGDLALDGRVLAALAQYTPAPPLEVSGVVTTPTARTLSVNGVVVPQRATDLYVNASQILGVLGLPENLRAQALSQLKNGVHVSVEAALPHGGVYLPVEAARTLAAAVGLAEALQPLVAPETSGHPLPKKLKPNPVPVYTHDGDNPGHPYTLTPLAGGVQLDMQREQIMLVFIDEHSTQSQITSELEWDTPIDDSGHTALHWAATLGRVELVEQLVLQGRANRLRGNVNGESALVQAVLATNNYDRQTFARLLDTLYPCIVLLDLEGRSVLHHIAYTSGLKGRGALSRYYLEQLLEWVVARGLSVGQLSLGRFMSEVVNVQDRHGDTCLNIAARVGNRSIVQWLLDVGADPAIANKAGLKPTDFGIGGGGVAPISTTTRPAPPVTQQLLAAIVQQMQQALGGLQAEFQREVEQKQAQLEQIHEQLRSRTLQLREQRAQVDHLTLSERELVELRNKIANLDRAIADEEERFKAQLGEDYERIAAFEGEFDADEPFRVLPVYQRFEQHKGDPATVELGDVWSQLHEPLPPLVMVEAWVRAYKRNQEELVLLAGELHGKSASLEAKFRRVVALCTGEEEDKVDELLDELVRAVEEGE